ncbi:MAG: OsmC family peroxiredoxin [Anaerolineae bacterium]|nr:OsmC family peroxiredoxin [Anaerolineae bacterium]
MAVRQANAVWNGKLRDGSGVARFSNFEGSYTFVSRFEEGDGTNPEEMLGAAHAACFSMALSANLERAGFEPQRVQTTAHVHLEKTDAGQTVTKIVLVSEASVGGGIDNAKFQEVAEETKKTCPISRALATNIELNAKLV